MKKLIICLLAFVGCINTKAQAPDIVHGINAGPSSNVYLYSVEYGYGNVDVPIAPSVGYFLDVHMRGRTWLFMQFNLQWQNMASKSTYLYNGATITRENKENYFDLYVPIRFGFRLGKEDAKFTFFPTAGFGVYLPVYYSMKYSSSNQGTNNYNGWLTSIDDVPFYPLMNIGFEAKWKISQRNNVAIGFNSDYLIANNIIYLKFGWNKYKKDKKKE